MAQGYDNSAMDGPRAEIQPSGPRIRDPAVDIRRRQTDCSIVHVRHTHPGPTMLVRILTLLAAAVILFWAMALYVRRMGMFFPERYPGGRWDAAQWTPRPEDHLFTTEDGVKLHAWLFRAREPRAPVMVWFHGNGGNLTHRADVAAELAQRGISVFVFDWRGYGKSGGRPSESGLFRDSIAAADYARARFHSAAAPPLVLYGESLGGPYAAWVARERRGAVRSVIIENSFPSLREVGNALYAPLPLGWTAPFALTTTQWLNGAGVPVLVIHGTRDEVIPYELGRRLYEGLTTPKEMLTTEATHDATAFDFPQHYYGAVVPFALAGGRE